MSPYVTRHLSLRDPTSRMLFASLAVLLVAGPWLPSWALSLATIALGKGLVVLGLLLLMRTGLVSFGQGLYYCIGAYAAGLLAHQFKVTDGLLMLAAAALACGLIAFVLGALLAAIAPSSSRC